MQDQQVIVDGVCSVASEAIKFDDWGIDVILTASQKGLGRRPVYLCWLQVNEP